MRWNRAESKTHDCHRGRSGGEILVGGRGACAMLRDGTLGAHLLRMAEAATLGCNRVERDGADGSAPKEAR